MTNEQQRLADLYLSMLPSRIWELTGSLKDGTPTFSSREVTPQDRADRKQAAQRFAEGNEP